MGFNVMNRWCFSPNIMCFALFGELSSIAPSFLRSLNYKKYIFEDTEAPRFVYAT